MRLDYLPAQHGNPRPAPEPAPPRPAPLSPAAILQLQRTAGNRAVAGVLARRPAPAEAPDPWIIEFARTLWPDDLASQVRLVLEPTRLFPVVGLVGGGVADLIGAGQDLLAIPVGDILRSELNAGKLTYGGLVGATVALRSAINIANNGVGHLLTFPQAAVELGLSSAIGEAATGVGAPLALATLAATGAPIAVAEALSFIKIALNAGTTGLDLIVSLEAAAGALMFPDDAEEWFSLGFGYMANVGGDMLGMLNDAVGIWLLGASPSGALSQGLATTMGVAKIMAKVFSVSATFFGMIWNVRGGDAVKEIPMPEGRTPEPPENDLRSPADAPPSSTLPLPRQAVEGAATGSGWAAARMIELDAMRDAVRRGEPIVRPLAEQMATLVASAAAHAEQSAAAQDAIRELRDSVGPLLADFEGRLELVAGVEGQATPALEQLDIASGQIAAAIAIVEHLTVGELGDGAVLDTIEGAVDAGFDMAKEAVLVPLRELLEGLVAIRGVVEAMIESARIVTPYLQDAIAQLQEILAAADGAPDPLQAMIDASLEFATAGEITSFGEMMSRWDQLMPEFDAAAGVLQERSSTSTLNSAA
jgi:hypothetical protein